MSRAGLRRSLSLVALLMPVAAAMPAALAGVQTAPAPSAVTAEAPTYVRDVAPLLNQHCVECHRPGQMAPMSFLTYEATRPWARAIQRQVVARTMPPWGADPAVGHFANDPSLSTGEVATIARWVDAGAPRGDGTPPPPPAAPSDEWHIGTPDLILSMEESFPIPATGIIEYQYFKVPTHLKEDRWVTAVEIRPGEPRAVHHLRVFAQGPERDTRPVPTGREMYCIDEVCGNLEPPLIGWGPNLASVAVGTRPEVYELGSAKLLKAGSVLTLHTHYTSFGEASTDRTRVGFRFAKTPPAVQLKTVSMAQEQFAIPPGDANHEVKAALEFREPVLLHSLGPHAHLRGRSWRFWLQTPDGTRTELLSVPRFDFDWQLHYVFKEPIAAPAGSRLEGTATFDNSTGNVSNPDPTATVRWGPLTVDEMMFASVVYSADKK